MKRNKVLYSVDGLPLLQNTTYVTATEARACATGRVELMQHPETGIVTNMAFDSARIVYDERYQNEQGHSSVFRSHLEAVADLVCGTMDLAATVEIGCGKGTFVDLLASRGVRCTGFDPAYEGRNPLIRAEPFTASCRIQATAIVLRHVLEHLQDPVGFLGLIREANGGAGMIYIEVPCFDWICRNRTWFDVFYEHVNYFRTSDFMRMFGDRCQVNHCFNGQYLGIIADLATLGNPADDGPRADVPADFSASLRRSMDADADTRPCAVWGASSKGVIFASLRERLGMPVDCAIDVNPAKQGRHLPVTGVRVLSPREALAALPRGTRTWVMNSNYMNEIESVAGQHLDLQSIDHLSTTTNGGQNE